MSKNIRRYSKLLVVSDTGMVKRDGEWYAFGPVVIELIMLLNLFESITWVGFNRPDQIENSSYLEVTTNEIELVALQNVGGKTIGAKASILMQYPKMWKLIHSEIKKHSFIHCRAPSNPAFIAMQLSKKYESKQFWFKYAGSWVDDTSYFYNLQRNRLKNLGANSKVTVNGNWENQASNILAFENPCLTEKERELGKEITNSKLRSAKVDFCFVGGLNENKGIALVLDAFNELKSEHIGTLHIVGDGLLRKTVEKKASQLAIKTIVYGALAKVKVVEIFKKSHFLLLPSKSEGFPKVIGEAMNYGCIPIVSNISCIGQYIKNGKNGFLINLITKEGVIKAITESFQLTNQEFYTYLNINFDLAESFTYSFYQKRILKEIFKN